ncbi:hypothetical protein CPB85DRAFT_1249375 [Mucidula mucida]|nr:hypothetical protein CPB85DRAFT_1249375 [Mucidula mucida]
MKSTPPSTWAASGGRVPGSMRAQPKKSGFIKRLYERMKQLVSPLILCTDALPILEDMTRVGTMDAFPWRLDSHYHGVPCPRSPPPDALETLWTLPDERGHWTPDIAENSGEYKPLCEDYIQKAWVASVKLDTTILTFDCGNFLRFGIRHRQSQTLFLSDLIDIRSCKEPAYGGLLLALDVAAAFDAVNRLPLLESHSLGKRKSTADSNRPSLSGDTTSYIASFKAVAVFFRLDEFDSPAPFFS